MQKEEFIIIANKVAEGLASDQEKQLFLFHLGTFAKENPEWEKIDADFRQQVEEDIRVNIRDQVFPEVRSKSKSIKLWQRVAGIAAAIALITYGIYFFNNSNNSINNDPQIVSQDVAPGSFGATLTLANGKTIRLSDASNGKLAQEEGIAITKSADGQLEYEIKGSDSDPNKINTLSTAKGETYKVRLPDGSLVYLNAASSLTYPVSLNERGRRVVKLRGEGYFEIFKDKAHPFIVKTAHQEIEVLGTQFNVNAYQDETETETTLAEGSIRLTSSGKSIVLKPSQQATTGNGNIAVKDVDAELALAWKSGFFLFDRESLESIMTKLARWYDVEVVYNEPALKSEIFTATVSRFEKISQVFNVLERAGGVKFKIDGKKITIYKLK